MSPRSRRRPATFSFSASLVIFYPRVIRLIQGECRSLRRPISLLLLSALGFCSVCCEAPSVLNVTRLLDESALRLRVTPSYFLEISCAPRSVLSGMNQAFWFSFDECSHGMFFHSFTLNPPTPLHLTRVPGGQRLFGT